MPTGSLWGGAGSCFEGVGFHPGGLEKGESSSYSSVTLNSIPVSAKHELKASEHDVYHDAYDSRTGEELLGGDALREGGVRQELPCQAQLLPLHAAHPLEVAPRYLHGKLPQGDPHYPYPCTARQVRVPDGYLQHLQRQS
ncbi:MAG: hypothetical protein FRX49_09799 [Trebouxia sp. A1-2]|nr:MAG: hypothetical protein FRX49_09799 [Trebouxia sp. A1-2]